MAFEQTRDFRSSTQDSKRFKEHAEKWSRGFRPLAGCKLVMKSSIPETDRADESRWERQLDKVRPLGPSHHSQRLPTQNVVKPRERRFEFRTGSSRAKMDAQAELNDPSNVSRSLHELLPSPHTRRSLSISDNIMYSFDRAESPYKPLALDVFVKTNPKEMERFVEKEYEVLDNNGEALKGRKARQNLRRKNHTAVTEESDIIEDDGFELV
ncbi:hypothetical protein F4804DRAFT_4939 [Jackrogersella minutella]|nr:hypothetical protein F4804DRAFT_4939 [Jackrogersella minutella]